jgi:hypothetical protein
VSFQIPATLDILFVINLANNPSVPANAVTQIQNAIIGAFAGSDGGPAVSIGTEVYASRYYSTVAALGSWAQIVGILLGSTNTPAAIFTASISGTTMTVSAVASGTLAPKQTLTDATGDITTGTTIVNQLTGTTGSTGTYTISASQTVLSETVTSVLPTLLRVPVSIAQIPAVAAPNIVVNLI